ncbi:hypothetical protein [Desulforhopalus sp. 52FAK]
MSGYKRRNFFIKKAFQAKLLFGYFFFVISGGLFFIVLMGFFTTDSMTISYSSNDLEMVHTPIALLKQSIVNTWPYLLVGSLFLAVVAIHVTHRVAGPLYRFEQTLDSMLTGNLGDSISLRSKDEGKELAAKINTFNSDLSMSIHRVQFESNAIKTLLEEAHRKASLLPEDKREDLQSILWSIDEKNKKIALVGKRYSAKV